MQPGIVPLPAGGVPLPEGGVPLPVLLGTHVQLPTGGIVPDPPPLFVVETHTF